MPKILRQEHEDTSTILSLSRYQGMWEYVLHAACSTIFSFGSLHPLDKLLSFHSQHQTIYA